MRKAIISHFRSMGYGVSGGEDTASITIYLAQCDLYKSEVASILHIEHWSAIKNLQDKRRKDEESFDTVRIVWK